MKRIFDQKIQRHVSNELPMGFVMLNFTEDGTRKALFRGHLLLLMLLLMFSSFWLLLMFSSFWLLSTFFVFGNLIVYK